MKYISYIKLIITLIVVGILLFSCREKQKNNNQKLSEGEILFKIVYPQEVEDNDFYFIYPQEMVLSFKDNFQRLSFKGSLGLYSFEFIFGDMNDTVYTLLKVNLMEKKLYVPTIGKNLLVFSESAKDRIVDFTDDTKEIAGLIAKKVIMKSNKLDIPDIEVWYSDEFQIDNPNKYTPFSQIPGIILESEIIFENVKFCFSAVKITASKIKDEIFSVPSDYILTSIYEIEQLLYTVF